MKNTMRTELTAGQYMPEALFEKLCARLGVPSYSALGVAIGLSPSVVSKIRNRKVAISSEILLKIHDATDIPVRELRRWMGDTRPYYSPLSSAVICPARISRLAARRAAAAVGARELAMASSRPPEEMHS